RAASAKAIDMLKAGCPKELPSIPTGRLAAMESRLQVMLAAVQTVRPALERFYQSLSDEQKARFNAIAPADDRGAAAKDQRDLTKLCPVGGHPTQTIICAVYPRSHRRASAIYARAKDGQAGGRNETSPPKAISASGSGRCRAASGIAVREGASLSVAAGASDRATRPCRRVRHHGAPDRTMAVGAAPARVL